MIRKKIFLSIFASMLLSILAACSNTVRSNSSIVSDSFKPVVAVDESFAASAGSFFMSKGRLSGAGPNISDNGIIVTNGGKSCVQVHAYSQNLYGATGVEVQWDLQQPTDMKDQKFTINFDVYVPAASRSMMTAVQFAFYNTITADYTPIYSCYFDKSVIAADTWCHISVPIKVGQYITYSGFAKNPGDWIFDKVRIQFLSPADGQDIMFDIANLVVLNTN